MNTQTDIVQYGIYSHLGEYYIQPLTEEAIECGESSMDYQTALLELAELKRLSFDGLVFDEVHHYEL